MVTLHFILMETCNVYPSLPPFHTKLPVLAYIFHSMFACSANCHLSLCVTTHIYLCSLNGSSSTSETFNNPCLSRSREFEVKDVEVRYLPPCHTLQFSSYLLMRSDSDNFYQIQLWGFVNASKYDEMLTICRTEKQGIWNLWLSVYNWSELFSACTWCQPILVVCTVL